MIKYTKKKHNKLENKQKLYMDILLIFTKFKILMYKFI